jgi:hypothetical protein
MNSRRFIRSLVGAGDQRQRDRKVERIGGLDEVE